MNTLSLLEKQFIIFKMFLSMRKIFLSAETENLIKVAYFNSHAGSIDLDAPDEYYALLLDTIEKTKEIYSNADNFRIKTNVEENEEISNNETIEVNSVPLEEVGPQKLLSKYSNVKP